MQAHGRRYSPLRRKDFIIVGITVAAALTLGLVALLSKHIRTPTGGSLLPLSTQAPAATSATIPETDSVQSAVLLSGDIDPTPEPTPTSSPAATQGQAATALAASEAYLSVQIGNIVYDPIPLFGQNEFEIVQPDGKRNVVSYTPQSIRMKEASCDNQDCVHQGEVTLDNMNKRILNNMVICLPNQVVLMLLTPEEAQAQMDSVSDQQP